ncbi:sugar phosphate isomerase/epimerase [Bradyrhizobium sp. GM0.4]
MRDFSQDHRWLSLNTATVREQGDLGVIIDECARAGIRAISPWRDQIAAIGLDRVVRMVRDAGLELSGYCRGGMFPADASQRIAVRDDNRRAVDEAKALNAPCLVLVVGGLPQYSRPRSCPSKDIIAARSQVEDGIAELFVYAKNVGMPLAIEPLHPAYAADRACVNTVAQALDICDRLDADMSGQLGLALDVYHVWWDPALITQIHRAGRERLLAFHVCDWTVPTKDILNDRGMMGDGVIDIPGIRRAVEAEGFTGYSEIEIFSHHWWARPIDEVIATCIARHKMMVRSNKMAAPARSVPLGGAAWQVRRTGSIDKSTFGWYKRQISMIGKSLILLYFDGLMSSPPLGTIFALHGQHLAQRQALSAKP